MKIWAHRGCSQAYPENTMLAFEKAVDLQGITGIELDIQLTKDGEIVVIHDERIDRTTEGLGFVRDYTFSELRKLHIYAGGGPCQRIPAMEEVFDLMEEKLRAGLKLNIELKTGNLPYHGIEEKIVGLVHKRGLEKSVVYSSFYAKTLENVHQLDADAELGILDSRVSDCMYKQKGCQGVSALHPFWRGMDLPTERLRGYTVRAWFGGHLYPEKPTGGILDLGSLENQGITDVFLNEPEKYLG